MSITEVLVKAFVPLAVFSSLAFFSKYLPSRPIDQESMKDLDARFRKLKWIFPMAMIAIGILFAWSTYSLLVWINWRLALADGPADFTLFPQNAMWFFVPLFGAFALSYEITLQMWSFIGNREDAGAYGQWTNQRSAAKGGRYAGMDFRKVLRWLALLIATPAGILTALALPMHVALRQTDIRDCGYGFRPCQIYSYSSAIRMTVIEGFRTRAGKLTRRAGVVLDFADGRRWSSADIGDFQTTVDSALVDFLEKKTHLPVNYSETEEEISK